MVNIIPALKQQKASSLQHCASVVPLDCVIFDLYLNTSCLSITES